MRISDWSSDVCSSDLRIVAELVEQAVQAIPQAVIGAGMRDPQQFLELPVGRIGGIGAGETYDVEGDRAQIGLGRLVTGHIEVAVRAERNDHRSEEHTSELQSLMRTSYAVVCLKIQHQSIIHHARDNTHIHTDFSAS